MYSAHGDDKYQDTDFMVDKGTHVCTDRGDSSRWSAKPQTALYHSKKQSCVLFFSFSLSRRYGQK